MSKSTEQLLKESIAEGWEFIEVLKETVALLKRWVDELRQEKEARFGEWTTLAELRPGAIFETEEGERGVKVQPLRLGQPVYWASLATGRLLGLALEEAETIKVREIQIP